MSNLSWEKVKRIAFLILFISTFWNLLFPKGHIFMPQKWYYAGMTQQSIDDDNDCWNDIDNYDGDDGTVDDTI